ncbi:MAG: hypothetical protein BroJett040_19830 [Oligoflexia bacterium]|nr:MAG: hypothetical protein BroJett040_19830 [Oligoflexia bacterium]
MSETTGKSDSNTKPTTDVGLSIPELSPEDLDKLIAEEDPELVQKLKSIGEDKGLSISQVDLEESEEALAAEVVAWRQAKGFRKIIFKLFPFAPRISFFGKRLVYKIKMLSISLFIRLKNFVVYLATDGRKALIATYKEKRAAYKESAQKSANIFRRLSPMARFMYFSSIALFILGVAYIYWTYKHGIIPKEKELFISNLEDHATKSYEYDRNKGLESFYDNPRSVQNIILLKKMVVNIRPSKSSGQNPMAALEFYVEGMSSEVLLEIKDREVMVRDLMQRVIEEMTYDQLDTSDGKRELCSRLQKELNRSLTTGKAKNVRIKTIVIKP